MIISRTPLRISFLGGGTDYPDHYRIHGGATLAVSIDKHSYITVSPLHEFFGYRFRISYSRTELVGELEEIQHPAVRECLRFMKLDGGLEIHYIGDLPARTGLGGSSSFTVGLLHTLHAFKGEMVSQAQLAAEAVYVEQECIRERVGSQDQYACALGGLRHLVFRPDLSVETRLVVLPAVRAAALQERLMLFYTGIQRSAHEVLEEQVDRTRRGVIADDLVAMGRLVGEGVDILTSERELSCFGEVLHAGWLLKQRLSSGVSSPAIDEWYARARAAGAVGGKLLGAGGGGFLLLFVEPARHDDVRQALAPLRDVPARFEAQGSTIIFYRG